jgi:hypothetical protein
MNYRKKPIVIYAIKWDGNLKTIESFDIPGIHQELDSDNLYIPTLEGVMRAEVGDYIIRGVKDEFYPCKPDIFEATYEKVD